MSTAQDTTAVPVSLEAFADRVPHLSDYFQPWAIRADELMAQVNQFNAIDFEAHLVHVQAIQQAEPRAARSEFARAADGKVAVIELNGEMMKPDSSLGGASTVRMRRQVRAAVNDSSVQAIAILIDSPGGTVAGTKDLADDVYNAAKSKPVLAYIEDLGASAAYWVASQATEVWSNESGLVGSIGTFAVIYDASRAAEEQGLKVHVVRAGDFKGAGVTGTEVTEEQLAEWQRLINEHNDFFVRGVARGRKNLTTAQVRELADGRVHMGKAAQSLGLIDKVGTFDEALRSALQLSRKGTKMSTSQNESQAATLAELRSALPKADAEFLLQAIDLGATVQDAQALWAEALEKKLEAAQEETGKAKAEAEEAKEKAKAEAEKSRGGIDHIRDRNDGDSDRSSSGNANDFRAKVREVMEERGWPKHRATRHVCTEHPELREAFVEDHNSKFGRSA